jgi:hypothetical protein
MNDETLSGVPRDQQQPDRAHERQRRSQQHDERFDERLKLQNHHADHTRGGESEHHEQRAECLLLTRVLPPNSMRIPGGGGVSASTPFTSVMTAPSARSARPRGRDHLLLVLSAGNFRTRLGRVKGRERPERSGSVGLRGGKWGSDPSRPRLKRTESGARNAHRPTVRSVEAYFAGRLAHQRNPSLHQRLAPASIPTGSLRLVDRPSPISAARFGDSLK